MAPNDALLQSARDFGSGLLAALAAATLMTRRSRTLWRWADSGYLVHMTKRLASRLTIAMLAVLGCAKEPEPAPTSYDDCILAHVKSGMNEGAVALLQNSCRAKFPLWTTASSKRELTPAERELTPAELALLDGRGGVGRLLSDFSGSLYNGNAGLTVVSVRIRITSTAAGKIDTKLYEKSVSIAPWAAASFSFGILVGEANAKYDWSIESAAGFRSTPKLNKYTGLPMP